MKKTISVLLSIALALSMFSLAFAAGSPSISVSSATARAGDTVELTVSISDNPGFNTFSLGFLYDTSRLSLTNVTLADGIPGQFTYSKKAVWLNSSDVQINGAYLNLTFKVFDDASVGDASVAVTYNTGDISNYNEDDVDFNLVAGKITVEGNTPTPSTEGTITVSSAAAKPGDTVELTLSISNNPGFNTFSLGFSYDTSRLSLTNVTLANGIPGQFTYSKKAVWLSSSDIQTNGAYLNLSFKVLDNAPVGDASVAVTYNAGDISNYNEEDVDFNLVAGKITVQEHVITDDRGTITVSKPVAKPGDEVDVTISVSNNPGVIGMSLNVSYDEALTLIRVVDGSILGSSLHSTAYSSNPYYLNWANDTADSNFTENGTLATLTFKVADDAPDGIYNIQVSYDNDDFEIFNFDAETVEFELVQGGIEIKAYIIGDINGDGKINAQDRLILSRYIAKWPDQESKIVDMRAADINCDGKVNAQDRLILARYIAKWDGYSEYFSN